LETPAIEYTDALGKFLPDQDRPNEGVFSFPDDDEQWLSLRYDLTAPLARHVAENFQSIALPFRSYREGYVFRNEKPGPGRFRQFLQFDADTVGSASMAADAEMCMLAADTMEALGFKRGDYVVKVSSRKVLDELLEDIGLGGDANATTRLTVLRAIDKLDRLGKDGVQQLLGSGRKDESGDFTKGAGLSKPQIQTLIEWLSIPPDTRQCTWLDCEEVTIAVPGKPVRPGAWRVVSPAGYDLMDISYLCGAAGYETDRIRIDRSVVRGLEYYTGPVYEIELLIETKDEKGRPVRFGSVGGGGRYDGLVSRFRGEPVPATGFSIGVSRLQAALTLIGKLGDKAQTGPVVVTVFDKDRIADYQKFVAQLRNAGIRAELYLGNPKHSVGQQLKYADKRNSPCAVIQGPDEKAKGEVTIKDLRLGAELAVSDQDRSAHLEKQTRAQRSVREAQLVEEVRKILDRQ
jgi:histidyl-tRNA synthetase